MTNEHHLMLTIKNDGKPLPELFRAKVEAYAYDYLTARNDRPEVELKEWMRVQEVQA